MRRRACRVTDALTIGRDAGKLGLRLVGGRDDNERLEGSETVGDAIGWRGCREQALVVDGEAVWGRDAG